MSTKLTVKDLLERNKQLASTHKPIPYFSEMGALGMNPPQILVITCVDARSVPEDFLGLKFGDAICMRNICGHVTRNLNDVLAADNLLNLNEIMIVHHTDCGSTQFKNDQVRKVLKKRCPTDTSIDSMEFGAITDLEQSVKDDLAIIKQSPLVRKELAQNTYGFLFDIKTGLLTPVEE